MKTKYSDQICIKEVLIAKYDIKMLFKASIIFNKFKNNIDEVLDFYDFSDYEINILKLDNKFPEGFGFIESHSLGLYNSSTTFKLTDIGKEFIKRVQARKETRYLLNKNCDLFPETANLIL